MRTASLKTFPQTKTKIRYRGCMGNGLPQLLVQGGGIRTSVIQRGGWKNHSWSSIAEMSEFDLFRLCFPDNYIWEVNKEARGSNENASNNIGQGANQEDIAELRRQGLKVENEERLPENLPTSENENQIPEVHG